MSESGQKLACSANRQAPMPRIMAWRYKPFQAVGGGGRRFPRPLPGGVFPTGAARPGQRPSGRLRRLFQLEQTCR